MKITQEYVKLIGKELVLWLPLHLQKFAPILSKKLSGLYRAEPLSKELVESMNIEIRQWLVIMADDFDEEQEDG